MNFIRLAAIKRLWLVILLCAYPIVSTSAAIEKLSATANPEEEETFAAFEWFCLAHMNKPADVSRLFSDIDVPALPESEARSISGKSGGKAWMLRGSYTALLVVQSTNGACAVVNHDTKIGSEAFKGVFEANTRHRLLTTKQRGSETDYTYAVTSPNANGDPDIHSMVVIATSNLSSVNGIHISAIPERALAAEKIKSPKWP